MKQSQEPRIPDTLEARCRAALWRTLKIPQPEYQDSARCLRIENAMLLARDLIQYLVWLPAQERAEVLSTISKDTLLCEDLIEMAEALMDLSVKKTNNQ